MTIAEEIAYKLQIREIIGPYLDPKLGWEKEVSNKLFEFFEDILREEMYVSRNIKASKEK